MNENNYECPKCHNIFPFANKFLHDNRCTESNPLPLNASRLVGINDNKKNDNQPIQHRPQPKITAQRRPDSHINPVDIKESIVPIPETFLCWLCGQTLPEKEREDHMLCHKMQEEVDNYKNDIEKNNQQRPSERPNHNQPRSNQNQQKPPQRPNQNQQRPPQRPNQNQQRPPQRPTQNQQRLLQRPNQNQQRLLQRPNQNQQRSNQRPNQNQQRSNQRPNQNQQRSNQRPNPQRANQRNQIRNNNNINIRRSFIPFDDIEIFDFNQIHESLNRMDNPTDIDILNELPETEIGDISRLDSEKRNCLICLENFETGDKATMLPCIHMFHSNCIQEWLKSKNTCPLCKLKLTRDNL